jgi:proteic killer suppression protein
LYPLAMMLLKIFIMEGALTVIIRTALRKLDMLNVADRISDLREPPGNRLEALKGDFKDYHSIRVNDQWRIIFQWKDNNAYRVLITDYH